MTNIQELYDICSRENITIDFIDCPKCGAISLFGAGGCAIGIDSQTPARLLKERTAHEIGHCVRVRFTTDTPRQTTSHSMNTVQTSGR